MDGIQRNQERRVERGQEVVELWNCCGRQIVSDDRVCGWTGLERWLSATSMTGCTSLQHMQ